jgi:hypothetical protein
MSIEMELIRPDDWYGLVNAEYDCTLEFSRK